MNSSRKFVALALVSFATAIGVACKDDATDNGTGAGALDGGLLLESGSFDGSSSDSPSNPNPDAAIQLPPSTSLSFPLDRYLVTTAKPLNIDEPTEVAIDNSLHYTTAYFDGGPLSSNARMFRFTSRTHTTAAELSANGIRVWWRSLVDNMPGNFICRAYTAEREITIKSTSTAGEEAEPGTLWRDQCSWTLWKHETEDSWAIRAPEGASTDEGGMFVTQRHSTADEGYRIRVDGAYLTSAPFFKLTLN